MERKRSAPIVAAALSGFVIGVILTLLATGILSSNTSSSSAPATLPAATPVADSLMYDRIRKIVLQKLGPAYPVEKAPRLVQLTLIPAGPDESTTGNSDSRSGLRSVFIRFHLNDNLLGRVWRLKTAQADVFAVLKALYTSQLEIYNVELEGMFPINVGKSLKERSVLIAFMDHHTAGTIPWRRWGRDHEAQVWRTLAYKYVSTQFA